MIDGLSTLSRVNRSRLSIQDVAIGQMAKEICQKLCEAHPDRDVRAQIEENLGLRADPVLMKSVLENLLESAFKFTSGVKEARIKLHECTDQPEVYAVCDNGPGFDMRYAGRLFGLFQRLHSPDEFEGMGIGLATVQRIIHRHGGRVWAKSQPGVETTFFFTVR
jgi:light-regulated signal transduction histidine kinase (bacteriophytochrome)